MHVYNTTLQTLEAPKNCSSNYVESKISLEFHRRCERNTLIEEEVVVLIRKIRLFGDPVLKAECQVIDTIDESVRQHVQDLLDTVNKDGRAGLASNQIGHQLRAFSLNIEGDISYMLNPETVSLDGEPELTGEGCLSVPDLWYPVMRYPKATVRGINLEGKEVVVEGEGLLAQALQHECDHLDGMLYIDRLSREERGKAMREIRASTWF